MSVASWNLGPGRQDFLPPDDPDVPVPIALKLRDKADVVEVAKNLKGLVEVSELYTELLPSLHEAFKTYPFATGHLVKGKASEDTLVEIERQVESFVLSAPVRSGDYPKADHLTAERRSLPSAGNVVANTVVLGIIDDGIAFAHDRFAGGNGTRFEAFWMQDGPPPGPSDIFGAVARGRELKRMEIDTLRAGPWPGNLMDEDDLYRYARVVDPAKPRGHKAIRSALAHGTHVLDVALSSALAFGAGDVRIVGVQLPIATTALNPATNFTAQAIEGLLYILLRSLDVADGSSSDALPVVINLSYGFTHGPHDGTDLLAQCIDVTLPLWTDVTGAPCELVLGAGNSWLERLHARVDVDPGRSVDLAWRIQPDDRTPSLVELWLPHPAGAPATSAVTLKAPRGAGQVTVTGRPAAHVPLELDGSEVARGQFRQVTPTAGRFVFVAQPTARLDQSAPIAPAGRWTLSIENTSTEQFAIDAYVARDLAPFGYPRPGRQSYFDQSDYVRFDERGRAVETDNGSWVKRQGSINGIATGGVPSVVGGYDAARREVARYSAGSEQRNPDAASPSDDSPALPGVLAAGTRSGSVRAMNGTSVAAPVVAGWVASRLSRGLSGNRAAVQTAAQNSGLAVGARDRAGDGAIVPPVPVRRVARRADP